jgi:hypothetical protein
VSGFSAKWAADVAIRVLTILKGSPVAKGGLALIAIGGMLVKPELIWAAVALLRQASIQEAIQNSSPSGAQLAIGTVAMAAGTLLLLTTVAMQWRSKPPVLVALRHQSFDGNSRALNASDLPPSLRDANIVPLDVDQSALFRNGVLDDPKAALRQQASLSARVNAHLRGHPGARVAYCGKAHIPLSFVAAHVGLSEVPVSYFELERAKAGWRWLDDEADGDDLGISVNWAPNPGHPGDAVIRVEISYDIRMEDVAVIVPAPAAAVQIRIAKPRIDCISTRAQVESIAKAFRRVLDELQNAPAPPTRIHLFLAAPMSVVVALGRLASPTIHKPLVVHNFSDRTQPRYAWGIEINGAAGPRVVKNKAKAEV